VILKAVCLKAIVTAFLVAPFMEICALYTSDKTQIADFHVRFYNFYLLVWIRQEAQLSKTGFKLVVLWRKVVN
jgi:uncharacterized RDD family membrane protein YckC